MKKNASGSIANHTTNSVDSGPSGYSANRRELLAGLAGVSASTLAGKVFAGEAASTTNATTFRLEAATVVTKARLDREVEKAFPLFNQASVLPDFDAASLGARNDVILRRIVTTTKLPSTGEKVDVTGLLAVPVGASGKLPIVSWQHGTILSFDQVPSNLTKLSNADYALSDAADSLETLFNIHRFASHGFGVIAADYVGKGPLRNGRGEGYAAKEVTVQTCTDVLNAGLSALREQNLEPAGLFLHGWSQGALNTQWLHQALRANGVAIEATMVASPFNDLSEAWSFWAGRESFPLPAGVESYPEMPAWISLCMIIALGSYELEYGLNGLLESAIRPEYRTLARKYWNDYATDFDTSKPFPSGSTLHVDGFFDSYTDDRNSAFLRHLAANRASYWHYDSPIRFCYGLADEAVHPAMVAHPLSAGGKLVTGVEVKNASHRATFLAGLYGGASSLGGHDNALAWFQSLI
jgi:hypothetical protein